MISRAHQVISYILVLFGLIHLSFARCLDSFDEYALWFTGAGIAIIFAGFINLIRAKSSEGIAFVICLLTNIIMLSLFVVALFAMQNIQVYIGIILSAIALFLSIQKRKI